MDFELSGDQVALRDAARDLLDGHAAPARVRAHVASGAPYDAALWRAMVDQGWLGVDLPEAAGGLGLGFVEAAVLMEQVGAHVAPAPFHQTLLALWATAGPGGTVGSVGSLDSSWAERLLAGALGTVAWNSGRDAVLVPYAPVAEVAIVGSPEGLVLHDLTAGDRPRAEPAMDVTRCVGWLRSDRPGSTEIGGPDDAAALLDRGAVATAAESLGAAQRALEMAVEHAKHRVQFGQPIGSFQAVKHRCADMLVDVEGMRSTTYHAAWCVAADDSDRPVAASTAKVWCADAARRTMASALQVHGGIGFTWEHDLHLFLKRAQLDQVTFGDAPAHRERLAHLLRATLTAGAPIL
jgi:alkylation response protein AidB-like acyl-CoA dehydrogenase